MTASREHRPPDRSVSIQRLDQGSRIPVEDRLAVEEPLAIQVASGERTVLVTTTMRTPGHDAELAVGWLHAEGIVRRRADIADVAWCVDRVEAQHRNLLTVRLRDTTVDLDGLRRSGTTTSACGVCGKSAIDAISESPHPAPISPVAIDTAILWELPGRLRRQQATFDSTGGLHAAALFTTGGELLGVREDVGRHNALDKLVGAALLDGELPWHDSLLLLSGRASFELLQKAGVAGVRVVAAIGAPSTLAVEVADRFGITLIGFLRSGRANIYTRPDRVLTGAGVR